MGPPKNTRSISQQAFDEMVKENIDDLGMDPTEALQDAIETLNIQGVDLSGIVTCVPGEGTVKDNPVIQTLDRLKQLNSDWTDRVGDQGDLDEIIALLDKLTNLCLIEGSGNASISNKNGGLELVCSVLSKLVGGCDQGLVSALKTMASLIYDIQSSNIFQKNEGPKMVVGVLNDKLQHSSILNGVFSVIAAASTGNEIVKESFMELKVDELIIQVLRTHGTGGVDSLYDAIRVLLTPDDYRVVASQVYGYARKFAKIGIAEALVDSLKEGISSPSLVSASIALKAVAVNDEICRSVAESGGVDSVLQCIDDSGEQHNKTVARVCCSLLSKVSLAHYTVMYSMPNRAQLNKAFPNLSSRQDEVFQVVMFGSDSIKNSIVEKGGLDRLIKLSARFADDPSVLQEVMSIISILSLRSPDHAARAIEAGAGDLAIQAMQKFPEAHIMQRNACSMIRNLAARNPENRTILLKSGIEKIIRKAKENHESCKAAATDALRDLGLNDYNL